MKTKRMKTTRTKAEKDVVNKQDIERIVAGKFGALCGMNIYLAHRKILENTLDECLGTERKNFDK